MNDITKERFWRKVNKTDTCWVWTASKRNKGYGAFVYPSFDGDIVQGRAHRFSWEIHNGPIPTGMCVLHKCDNPACVNPEHLFLGTKCDNNIDMHKKGRNISGGSKTPINKCKYRRGINHHAYSIDSETIRLIRYDRQNGMSYGNMVKKYNVTIGYLWRICNRKARQYA